LQNLAYLVRLPLLFSYDLICLHAEKAKYRYTLVHCNIILEIPIVNRWKRFIENYFGGGTPHCKAQTPPCNACFFCPQQAFA
jgi:hypothetical protein